MRKIIKYLLFIIVITSNIDKFKTYESNWAKLGILIFIIVFIIFINYLFKKEEQTLITSPIEKEKIDLTKVDRFNLDNHTVLNKKINELRGNSIKIIWVSKRFRTNPLSKIDGGSTVVVLFENGKCFGYDNIKDIESYTINIIDDYITKNNNDHFNTLEEYVKEIYISNDNDNIMKIWDITMNVKIKDKL